jgi:flagellar protein FlgJ
MLTMMTATTTKPAESDMLAVRETTIRPAQGYSLRGKSKMSPEQIDATANEFESQFIANMLSNMFSTVESNEATGGGDAEDVYQSMLTNEYGKVLARTGGVGVADQVREIMMRQQEVE